MTLCFTDRVVSLASGHQRSERRSGVRTDYLQDRTRKLAKQREDRTSEAMVMDGVRVYINGYLSDTTDIEMKRTITQAGGEIVSVHFIKHLIFLNDKNI
jgi:hypothetical protein